MIRPDRSGARTLVVLVLASLLASLCAVLASPVAAAPTTWSITASPNPGSVANGLDGLACATTTDCVAVGFRIDGAGVKRTLVEQWAGATWAVVPSPNQSKFNNALVGVSCPASTTCIAVGSYLDGNRLRTLVETWDGTSWSITPSPDLGAGSDELLSVSCVSATSCVAAGYSGDSVNGSAALVETWDGASWSIASTPTPNAGAVLEAVACTGAMNCVAVGYSLTAFDQLLPLVERGNGTTWTVETTPNLQRSGVLSGISCPSETRCVAVGWTEKITKSTLVETWDGATWSVVGSPSGASGVGLLRSVSCATPTNCVAVGATGFSSRTLVESWDGVTWTLTPGPSPPGGESALKALQCTAATCVAVGYVNNGTHRRTLALSASSAPDDTPPTVTLSTPGDGSYFVTGQSATAAYTCADNPGGWGISDCEGTVPVGAPIDTSISGTQPFSVSAVDAAGYSTTVDAMYTVVDPSSTSTVFDTGGGALTTDDGGGPTPLAPIATTLESPNAGSASIAQGAVTQPAPAGFTLLGVQIDTTAPTADADAPLRFTIDLDAAIVPPSESELTLSLLHDGTIVPDCAGASTVTAGVDACVTDRAAAPSGGGDLRLTVISSTAGRWNIAAGAPESPELSISSVSRLEGNAGTSMMSFPVTLSAPSVSPVSVAYTTADATATAGSDYVPVSGSLDFAPGETTHNIDVEINGDLAREQNETFIVHLSAATGALIAVANGTGTILDDDSIAPGAPTGVAVTPGDTTAEVSWTAPADTGGRPIGGYVITPYVNGVAQTARVFANTATTERVDALANGTTYTFRVAAASEIGTGGLSSPSPPITVGSPTAPSVVAVGSPTSASLSWTVRSANGAPPTSYVVTVLLNGDAAPSLVRTLSCTQPCTPPSSLTVSGLSRNHLYTFSVRAANTRGAGPVGSTTISISDVAAVPGKPAAPIVDLGRLADFAEAIRVTWIAPTNGTATITKFIVRPYRNGVAQNRIYVSGTLNRCFYIPTGPGGTASFTFTVTAQNAVGTGPASSLSTPLVH